jgi:hypothetical protein
MKIMGMCRSIVEYLLKLDTADPGHLDVRDDTGRFAKARCIQKFPKRVGHSNQIRE